MAITMLEMKNRILTLCDTTTDYVNNMDDDAFTNLINDTQIELFRALYTIYNEDMMQENQDYVVGAGDGYVDFSTTTEENYNEEYYYYYGGYTDVNMPLVIFRIDRVVNNERIPMRRFQIANKVLKTESKYWGTNKQIQYDWRPPRIYFYPTNIEEETVRIYYVPRPVIITEDTEYLNWISLDHAELFTIIGAMKVFAKSETPSTELQRLYDNYLNRIKSMLPIDHGQPRHIQDVQTDLFDPFCVERDW